MSFATLGLSAELLRAIDDQKYSKPTPIQSRAIPVILQGKDVLAGAQTGTGKTAGFALPLLQILSKRSITKVKNSVRALILTPTRELAAQVQEDVAACGKYLPLKSAAIFGGVGINPQIGQLRRGVDVLVATPGRLLDHVQQRTLDLSKVEILVLDEADRMLDMGFIRDIRRILTVLPAVRQNLLFFATFSNDIKQLADGLLNSPELIEVAARNTASETIEQLVHPVDRVRKRELLSFLIGSKRWRQVLVFTRTKHGANKLTKQLESDGIRASAIHGNKSQAARTKALADFKRGEVRVLVATDIASRGLDIDHLPHVVNFELPDLAEDYVHRIGRTGRAEREGIAISLVCIDEREHLKAIERLLQREIPKEIIDGYEPDPSIRAEPIFKGGNRSGQRPGSNYAPGKFFSDTKSGAYPGAGRNSGSGKKRFPEGPRNDEPGRGGHDGSRKHVVKPARPFSGRGAPKDGRPSLR
ncbi:MAG: DEAD/DEAH box helicase [Syntrophobacteraceae bacterium]|nr:DEAD/DEAH box helicase [Syntrophobacteraceae bacterium]